MIHKISKRMTQALLLLSVIFVGLVTPATTILMQNWETIAHADVGVGGESGDCTWSIDGGVLTIRPTDDKSGKLGVIEYETEWDDNYIAPTINSVEIEPGVIPNENSSCLFERLWNCKTINGLTNLDMSNVTNMARMFFDCRGLPELDLSSFKTDNVTDMSQMFYSCQGLQKLNVSEFNTGAVTNMSEMFDFCRGLQQLDISSFKTDKVTNMDWMFTVCDNLKQLDVSSFDTRSVTSMRGMFNYCTDLQQLNVSNFNTSAVTDMSDMFFWCQGVQQLDLHNFDTSKVTNLACMFQGCHSLKSVEISSFNTSAVTYMNRMFCECYSLQQIDLSHFRTPNLIDAAEMFNYCSSLKQLDLSNFDTSSVTDVNFMFSDCTSLEQLDISNFNTSKVYRMDCMFCNCYQLQQLDLSSFETNDKTYMLGIFEECNSLWKLTLGANFALKDNIWVPDPIIGTTFDTRYTVNSTDWRIVGNGDVHHPKGEQLTAEQIVNQHNASGQTDTYVWQSDPLPNKTVTINYLDIDTGSVKVGTEQLAGEEGTNYTVTSTKLDALKAQGYEFNHADAGYPAGTFDSNKTINVYLKHTTTFTTSSKTIKQTIHYVDANQNTLAQDNIQELTFTHSVTTDNVTHAILNDVWTPEQITNAVTSPDIDGYTTSTKVVEGQVYTHTSNSANEINVVYAANVPVPAPIIGPNVVAGVPGLAPAMIYAQGTATPIYAPTLANIVTPFVTDDSTVKSANDSSADKSVEAADTQSSTTAWWALVVGILAASVALAGLWFLLFRRRPKG
ncbi:MAG: BspA family leucine-rich repeat surface protein [Lactobacillaceae bacterium]|nr:BspA family leucine-rich repeat surface protein [Lactobacillaceae bacterium]